MSLQEEEFSRPEQTPNFIKTFKVSNSVCDDLVEFFESNPERQKDGVIDGGVEKGAKDSTDINIYPGEHIFDEYMKSIWPCMNEYVAEYGYAGYYGRWTSGAINLQRYLPNQGFRVWHTERTGAIEPVVSRHLVFMTYLNDVTDDGGTEFFYQRKLFAPEKGLTLIWPADWTFTHRGIPSKTQTKYITTGWMNYIQ